MRWAVLILGLLGATGAAGFGGLMYLENQKTRNAPDFMKKVELLKSPLIPEADRTSLRKALVRVLALPYFLMATLPLALLGASQAMKRQGFAAAAMFFLSFLGPVTLIIGYALALPERGRGGSDEVTGLVIVLGVPLGFLVLASVLSFGVRGAPAAKPPRDEEDRDEED